MADKEILQYAGDFALDGILLIGSSGVSLEIQGLVQEINIYENIESPFLSGNLLIKDATGLAEIMPLIGQERLVFSIRTPGRRKIDFNEYHAIVFNVGTRTHQSDRAQSLIINFTTLENYKNIRTKVSKSFKKTISEAVQEILLGEKFLKTKKSIYIEPTKNLRTFVIPNLSPFDAINLMKPEAISKDEGSPHFLFYENQDGFHFRSLDSLLGKGRNLTIQHKATYKYQPPAPGHIAVDPNITLNTILHWEISNNTNSFLNMRGGMFSSTLFYHDIFNKNIQKFSFDYINDGFKIRSSTNQHKKNFGPQVSLSEIEDGKIITEFPDARIFVHPTGSDNLHTTGTSNSANQWLQESRSRELERKFFTLRIETYGNTNILVGDLLNIMIPSNRKLGSAEGKDSVDRSLTGRYLVTELHHTVIPSTQMHTMVMTVMKDSFENASTAQTLQYKEEPQGAISSLGNRDFIDP